MSTNEKEAERASGLFPFADIHLSTGGVGRRGVLAEAAIGKGEPPVDVGVVRLVVLFLRAVIRRPAGGLTGGRLGRFERERYRGLLQEEEELTRAVLAPSIPPTLWWPGQCLTPWACQGAYTRKCLLCGAGRAEVHGPGVST